MKAIEQTSLVLLSVSVTFLVLVVAAFAFDKYATQPSIYTTPPGNKDISNVKSLREATSLDGLKRVCALWAQGEDESRQLIMALLDKHTSMLKDTVIALTILSFIFSSWLLYIYFAARRLRRVEANAP